MMLQKSSNTIQAFWVMIGSLSAFGFAIASSMLLSRYFDKYDYGTYKQVMYVYSSLVIVFTLGLPRAFSFFLPRVTEGQAKDLISKINNVLFGLGAVMSIVLFIGAEIIGDLLKNKDIITPLRYFSLVPLFLIPTMGIEGILATYRKTIFLAVYKTVTQVLTLFFVVIPVVFFNGDVTSAIIGFTIAAFISFLIALFLKYQPISGYIKEDSPYSYREIFNYTLPIMGASIWGIIISSADQFFISRYFGNVIFAEFANGSMELPFVGMIIASTATVLTPVFAKHVHDNNANVREDVLALWRSALSKTIKIIYPLVAFCFCFADEIMIFLYGDRYHASGIFFQIKLVVNFFTVITYGPLLLSIGGQRFYYKVHAYGAIILIVLEWIAVSQFESPYIVTVVSVVCQICRIVFMIGYIAKYFNIPLKILFPSKLAILILIPSLIILFSLRILLVDILQLPIIISFTISALVYGAVFILWAWYKKIDYFSIVKPITSKLLKKR